MSCFVINDLNESNTKSGVYDHAHAILNATKHFTIRRRHTTDPLPKHSLQNEILGLVNKTFLETL